MSPQLTSIFGVVFVVMAGIQVWLMLETIGRKEARYSERILSLVHRVNGYLFLLLYAVFLVVMIKKIAAANAPLDGKSLLHMVLALSIMPLLAVKILIVRYYPKLFDIVVPVIGIMILVISFSLVAITGGYFFIKSATSKYVSSFNPEAGFLDIDVGRELTVQKCNKCHDLTRVFTFVKTPGDWKETVNRMAKRDPTWLGGGQIDQIVHYLSQRQNINKTEDILPIQIEAMLDTKCSRCHNIERVFAKRRTREGWRNLITRMSNRHRSWISDTEAKLIGDYLARVYGIKPETEVKLAAAVMSVTAKKKEIDFKPKFSSLGCVFCHGEEGWGEAPDTPDWTDPEWHDGRTDSQLFNSISAGVGKSMPSFADKLSEDEIQAAVSFVRGFREE